jgi:hypothetical protein
VQVVDMDIATDRKITFGKRVAEALGDWRDDIRGAIEVGSQAVAESLKSLLSPEGWRLEEVSASFGITLTAKASVIVSKGLGGRDLRRFYQVHPSKRVGSDAGRLAAAAAAVLAGVIFPPVRLGAGQVPADHEYH